MASSDLPLRARRAYEWGRVRAGVGRAWPLLPFVVVAMLLYDRHATTLVGAGVLALLITAMAWRGGALGRAIGPGLWGGVLPLVLPAAFMALSGSHHCAECHMANPVFRNCLIACVAGGTLGGLWVGLRVARLPGGRLPTALAAAVLSAAVGALGCSLIGATGVLGMLAGLAIGGAPALVLFPALARRAP